MTADRALHPAFAIQTRIAQTAAHTKQLCAIITADRSGRQMGFVRMVGPAGSSTGVSTVQIVQTVVLEITAPLLRR